MSLSITRLLGLDRAGDFFFALADATAAAARRALTFGPPAKARRSRPCRLEVRPRVEQLEPRWVLATMTTALVNDPVQGTAYPFGNAVLYP
jgi:hypothetical protein